MSAAVITVTCEGASLVLWENFDAVHRNFSQRCPSKCLDTVLPFDVPSLADLCSRNEAIRNGYSKCKLVP
jgi:hypothetical protein